MTPGEVMSVFHTLPHLVPKYEVVPVLRRLKKKLGAKHEDDTSEIQLKAFNESVRLYLSPTEGILASEDTPVWTVTFDPEAPEGLLYKQIPSVCSIYQFESAKPYSISFNYIYISKK